MDHSIQETLLNIPTFFTGHIHIGGVKIVSNENINPSILHNSGGSIIVYVLVTPPHQGFIQELGGEADGRGGGVVKFGSWGIL